VTARQPQCNTIFFFVFLFLSILNCAPYPIYTQSAPPQRHSGKTSRHAVEHAPEPQSEASDISFASAVKNADDAVDSAAGDGSQKNGHQSEKAPSFSIASRYLRVALRQNVKKANFSSSGQIDVACAETRHDCARGGIRVEIAGNQNRVVCETQRDGIWECALPCTLLAKNEYTIIDFDGTSFRGSMILLAERPGSFTVVNYTLVEDYLRGVVPLEIGHCKPEEAEAVKAQAIAARTYTYKKVLEKHDQGFDLFPTISDQVYGGVSAENPLCNEAILATVDKVMLSRDSLIYAYYHSTCGGKTANIEDVWENKQTVSYLRSIDDVDEQGAAYCGFSASFSWDEAWPSSVLSTIINRYSREVFPQNPVHGSLKSLAVDSRFTCGRARALTVTTSSGTFRYGGDKIRFILRRNKSGHPILRSALITAATVSSGSITLKGRGYGHGVGMCQFGAIGRARAGQSCEHILKAYYTGVEIGNVELAR
jgi:stage II sporulation protein D